MSNLLQRCAKLTVFLSSILGPDYEVILYDVKDKENSIIAISNYGISDRKLGDPIDDKNLELIETVDWKESPYALNYGKVSRGNKVLRCSTMFIEDDDGELAALLCVNFDDSNYRELNEKLLKLCHPDMFLDTSVQLAPAFGNPLPHQHEVSPEPQDPAEIIKNTIYAMEDEISVKRERFSKNDKQAVIKRLEDKGVFQIKGAIKVAAKELNSSIATIYRYLSSPK